MGTLPGVFRANLALVALALAAASSCYPKGWTPEQAQKPPRIQSPFPIGPYLLSTGAHEMSVVMESSISVPPAVHWWTDTNTRHTIVPAILHDGLWVAQLQDLPWDKNIYYQVRSIAGTTPVTSFVAGRNYSSPFRFAAFGDTRTGHEVHQAVINAVAAEDIDFFLHSGDMVETGGLRDQWTRFFQIESPLLQRRPIFGAPGNHDDSNRGLYRRFFISALWSEDNRFYVRDWGRLRIVAMDPMDECREGCSQYLYLEKALAEGVRRDMLMVMVVHYPPYSAGNHGSHLYTRSILEPLAVRYGVELVVAGHDHNYERTKPVNGVTYLVAASAGAPIRPVRPEAFTEVARTEPHYVLFDVDDTGITMRAVNLTGDTFDDHVIRPLPPNPSGF